jgi:hypothetical protein
MSSFFTGLLVVLLNTFFQESGKDSLLRLDSSSGAEIVSDQTLNVTVIM